ncbi:MAG: hypothetical protein D5R96_00095, partial [Methanocalculus sp. MSAO_Arc2]|uniref:AAA family ATPase n=1 Tax=Methanocalculus sp. MSAO_Arc2 TaxID=2293855 RepID=UPI000FEF05DE
MSQGRRAEESDPKPVQDSAQAPAENTHQHTSHNTQPPSGPAGPGAVPSRRLSQTRFFRDHSPGQGLFRDMDALEYGFMPDQVLKREDQITQLAIAARPGIRGMTPAHTICRGPPGTGKTTSIRHLFDEIKGSTKKLVPIYISCQNNRTKYMVWAALYRQLVG